MSETGPTVLLTRPRDVAEVFAGLLDTSCKAPFETLISPLMRIEYSQEITDLSRFATFIFTSAQGIHAIAGKEGLRGKTAYCVGNRTASVAAEHGFNAVSAGRNVQKLMQVVRDQRPETPIAHISGKFTRINVAATLAKSNIEAENIVAYAQVEMAPEEALLAALVRPERVIAPVFSPRSARLLSAHVPKESEGPLVVAISEAAAEAWNAPCRQMIVSEWPDATAVLEAVCKVIESDSPC